MNVRGFLLITLLSIFSLSTFAQTNPNEKSKEPVLVDLTENEKKINPRFLVENQPDFTAVESYFSAREISGFSASSKVARFGKKYRIDTGFAVVFTEAKKPTLRIVQDKTIEESIGEYRPFVSPTKPLNPTDLLEFDDVSFVSLGSIEVDGKRFLKIQAKSKEFSPEVFLYADLGQKNLISIIQIQSPQRSSIQRLEEVSFDVPKALFDLTGYQTLPKFQWNRVKTAKVFHLGREIPEALVYRHKSYVFVHVARFEIFLVDLTRKMADIVVFQGLLVAKDGRYIWTTTSDEAWSVGELEYMIDPTDSDTAKIESTPSSFSFADPKRKSVTLLRVEW